MSSERPSFRRVAIPSCAVAIAVLLAGLTIWDLLREHDRGRPEDDARPYREPIAVAAGSDESPLSREEALLALREQGLTRPVVSRLWSDREQRVVLERSAFQSELAPAIRIQILALLEREEPRRALDLARLIAKERPSGSEEIVIAAYGVLSRQGDGRDLEHLSPCEGESVQAKQFREACRARLEGRH